MADISLQIKQKAVELGFDLVGITGAETIGDEHVEQIRDFLDAGFAGGMGYMHRNFEKRINPSELLKGAQSVICVGLCYKPEDSGDVTAVADFALYEDYHGFIKDRLFGLAEFICELTGKKHRFKACVDSVPLAERSLAERAGLGFIARNHMLIHPKLGQRILLGELVTDLELSCDDPMSDCCPGCDKCVRACPTGALRHDGRFDASKCISYLTIEHGGPIPGELAGKMDSSLFGCDRCIKVCPYEIIAPAAVNKELKCHLKRKNLDPAEVLGWGERQFEAVFAGSCVERLGLDGLKRNAKICVENRD